MREIPYYKEMKQEIRKLNQLADEALKNGTPLAPDDAILEQSRKVDDLIVKFQGEMYGSVMSDSYDR
ncbi:MAG TPA: hypothetical protein GXX75_21480 [Clostridiales bacterium]|nr:hypothetical protein [Clostridiales bacterium]